MLERELLLLLFFFFFFSRQHLVEDTFFMEIGSNRRLINSSNYSGS